jgi:hypothetical protein
MNSTTQYHQFSFSSVSTTKASAAAVAEPPERSLPSNAAGSKVTAVAETAERNPPTSLARKAATAVSVPASTADPAERESFAVAMRAIAERYKSDQIEASPTFGKFVANDNHKPSASAQAQSAVDETESDSEWFDDSDPLLSLVKSAIAEKHRPGRTEAQSAVTKPAVLEEDELEVEDRPLTLGRSVAEKYAAASGKRKPEPSPAPLALGRSSAAERTAPVEKLQAEPAERSFNLGGYASTKKEKKEKEARQKPAKKSWSLWSWLMGNRAVRAEKQLRLAETLSLGEKRFVAVLQVDGRKFLVGGGASGVTMLTPLAPGQELAGALQAMPAVGD